MDSDVSLVVNSWTVCVCQYAHTHTHKKKKTCWREIRIKKSEVRLNVSSCLFPLLSLWQLHNLWTCPSGTPSKQQGGQHCDVTRLGHVLWKKINNWSLQRLAGNKDANSGLRTVLSSSVKKGTIQMMLCIKAHCVCSRDAEMRTAPCTGSYCNCQLTSSGSVRLQTPEPDKCRI